MALVTDGVMRSAGGVRRWIRFETLLRALRSLGGQKVPLQLIMTKTRHNYRAP
jgi:hypothetical protein